MSIRDVLDLAARQAADLQPRIERTMQMLAFLNKQAVAVNLVSMVDLLTQAKKQRAAGDVAAADATVEVVHKLLKAFIGELGPEDM